MTEFQINDEILKQVFALLSCSTDYEANLVFDSASNDYWVNEVLDEEYDLRQSKREFALDALRGVLGSLDRQGYKLSLNGEEVGITQALDTLIQKAQEEA